MIKHNTNIKNIIAKTKLKIILKYSTNGLLESKFIIPKNTISIL